MAAKAAGSRTAMSARIFRSTSTPADFSPAMKRPYGMPCWRDGGVDALDPEAPHVALAVAPVAVRVDEGVDERLARGANERRARAAAALGAVEQPLVAAAGGDAALDSGHRLLPLAGVRHQPLELLGVGVRDASPSPA